MNFVFGFYCVDWILPSDAQSFDLDELSGCIVPTTSGKIRGINVKVALMDRGSILKTTDMAVEELFFSLDARSVDLADNLYGAWVKRTGINLVSAKETHVSICWLWIHFAAHCSTRSNT